MYISPTETYYEYDGTQHSRRANFLVLASDNDNNLYAIVRKVALSQCGHWMMGKARIAGATYVVSGAYGNDGLPCDWDKDFTPAQQKRFTPVPAKIADAYWHASDPGWNSAGSEAPTMRQWARTIAQ